IDQLEPRHWAPRFEGLIQGDFVVQAALGSAPDLRFELRLDDSQLQGRAADVEAVGRYRDGALHFERVDAHAGRNRLRLSGQVLPTLAAEAQLEGEELAALLPGLTGRTRVRLRADGPLRQPRLRGEIEGEHLYYRAYGAERLRARFDLDPQQTLQLDAQFDTVAVGTAIDSAHI